MTDEGLPGPDKADAKPRHWPAAGFPPSDILTVFVDGVANALPNGGTVRYYHYRTHPDISGKDEFKNEAVAQIVMPMEAFLNMTLFFTGVLQTYIKRGFISQETYNAAREYFEANPPYPNE